MDTGTIKTIAAVLAAAAAVWGIYVYFSNSRLRRAEWLASLYEKFNEGAELKDIREKLDCEQDTADLEALVSEESRDFTDYLNFFEFVAVLQKSGQLTTEQIQDLFRYYLNCLQRSAAVRQYISAKGYEQLGQTAA